MTQILQQFINFVLIWAEHLGVTIKGINERLNNLELQTGEPVLYTAQGKNHVKKTTARNNLDVAATFSGTITPEEINWGVEYPQLILKTGDTYIQRDISNEIFRTYTFYKGNGSSIPDSWRYCGESEIFPYPVYVEDPYDFDILGLFYVPEEGWVVKNYHILCFLEKWLETKEGVGVLMTGTFMEGTELNGTYTEGTGFNGEYE